MLILSRAEREKLFIGDDVVVEVIEIRGSSVRLGITAPDDVAVDREEIRKKKDREQGRKRHP